MKVLGFAAAPSRATRAVWALEEAEADYEYQGIDPRAGSNIYEPFFTTKDVGSGTGLGLAVSLRLVEKMGGRLRHIRDRRGGACFHLSLPVSDPALGA